jgi:hypothetical protein
VDVLRIEGDALTYLRRLLADFEPGGMRALHLGLDGHTLKVKVDTLAWSPPFGTEQPCSSCGGAFNDPHGHSEQRCRFGPDTGTVRTFA